MTTGHIRHRKNSAPFEAVLSKVPEVTAFFWITKILTTGMGETASDYLATRLGPVPAVLLAAIALVGALWVQLSVRRYVAWLYWTTVVLVSIFGTMAADFQHVVLGVPYVASAIAFVVLLGVIFAVWYAKEKTLSIHSIFSRRRECFYWLTVMATFALGTATGDMTASTLHLGYLPSGVAFALLMAVPALAARWFGLNAVLAFWFAYIVTRPLGASFADWMGASATHGGLGMGTGPVTLALLVVIVLFVGYLAVSRRDVAAGEPAAATASTARHGDHLTGQGAPR
jgi:uncharacterized membrane-anchored protein